MKNIRSGPHQPEADAVFAGITKGKSVAMEHDRFMGLAMVAVVQHLVDTRLADSLTRSELGSRRPLGSPGVAASLAAVLRRREDAA